MADELVDEIARARRAVGARLVDLEREAAALPRAPKVPRADAEFDRSLRDMARTGDDPGGFVYHDDEGLAPNARWG